MAPTERSSEPRHSMILKLALIVLGVSSAAVRTCAAPTPCTATWGSARVTGVELDGVCRYSVRYGAAARWEASMMSDGPANAAGLPPLCPQRATILGVGEQSEDCLYAVVYAPKGAKCLPVLTWVHGGSNELGWAGYPGVDGSRMARERNVVVVVPQYRLGAFGFVPPLDAAASSDLNLGVKDVILALKAVKSRISYFGGDSRRVTLAGHSSGGQIVRAIVSAPAAKGLFHRLILQSDTMLYGLSSPRITGILQAALYKQPQLQGKTLDELRAVAVPDILAAQNALVTMSAMAKFEGVPLSMPFRPTFGTVSVPNEPTASLFTNPGALATHPSSVPLLITTAANEGADLASVLMSAPLPLNAVANATYLGTMAYAIGNGRASVLAQTSPYALPATSDDADIVRIRLERTITDFAYRCVARAAAQKYAAAGGSAYVGEWNKAPQYFNNRLNPFCSGRVCHQDDLYPTFGTSSGVDTTLQQFVFDQWASFIAGGKPSSWLPFTAGTSLDGSKVLALGGGQVPACPEGVFGETVKWDWQLYSF